MTAKRSETDGSALKSRSNMRSNAEAIQRFLALIVQQGLQQRMGQDRRGETHHRLWVFQPNGGRGVGDDEVGVGA